MALAVINFITIGESSTYSADFPAASRWGHGWVTQRYMPASFFLFSLQKEIVVSSRCWDSPVTSQCSLPQQCGAAAPSSGWIAQHLLLLQYATCILQHLKSE